MRFYLFLFVLLLSVPFMDLMAPPKRLLGDRSPTTLRNANSLHGRPGGIPFVPGNALVCDQAIEVRGILHGKLDPAKNTLTAVGYSASETDNLYTMANTITLTPYVENIAIREDVRADDEGNANPNDTLRMRVQETGGILQEDPTPLNAPSLYKQVDDTRGSVHTKLDAVDDGTPQTVGMVVLRRIRSRPWWGILLLRPMILRVRAWRSVKIFAMMTKGMQTQRTQRMRVCARWA